MASKPFVCMYEGCGKQFSKSSNLTQHHRIHSGEKPFECKKCGRKFRQSGNLTKHLKSHENAHLRWNRNTNEKPFKCTFNGCDKSFTAKSSLQNHIRMHTGEAPFVCSFDNCGERFHTKSSLSTHMRNVHGDSVKFHCIHPHCKRIFTDELELKKHLVAYSPGLAIENQFLKTGLAHVLSFVEKYSERDKEFGEKIDNDAHLSELKRGLMTITDLPNASESSSDHEGELYCKFIKPKAPAITADMISAAWTMHHVSQYEAQAILANNSSSTSNNMLEDGQRSPGSMNNTFDSSDELDPHVIMSLEAACGMEAEESRSPGEFDASGFLGLNMNVWPFVLNNNSNNNSSNSNNSGNSGNIGSIIPQSLVNNNNISNIALNTSTTTNTNNVIINPNAFNIINNNNSSNNNANNINNNHMNSEWFKNQIKFGVYGR